MKKILFISHDASRTGAPIVLLHFLKWLREHTDIPFMILLREGGELEADFNAIGPVIVLNQGIFVQETLADQLVVYDIGLIYSNTIVNGGLLKTLHQLHCPIISHIHELEHTIHYYGAEIFEGVKQYTNQYIAASEAIKTNLVHNHGISETKLEVIYPYISTIAPTRSNLHQARQQICSKLSVSEDALIVGGCGTFSWRKGLDLFVQLLYKIRQQYPELLVQFIWVGGPTEGAYFSEICHDVKQADLEPYIHFVGSQSDPSSYFAAFDVFALVSREDPFPLVCLEAASFAKPIVCFDAAGSMKEFVEDDCGFVLPYLDMATTAEKVIELLTSTELRDRLGQQAQQKVKERHDIEIAAPKILSIIQRYFPNPDISLISDRDTIISILEIQYRALMSDLKQTGAKLAEAHDQLRDCQYSQQQMQSQLQQVQVELQQTKMQISAMETSKFWKLRSAWFKLKRALGLQADEN